MKELTDKFNERLKYLESLDETDENEYRSSEIAINTIHALELLLEKIDNSEKIKRLYKVLTDRLKELESREQKIGTKYRVMEITLSIVFVQQRLLKEIK